MSIKVKFRFMARLSAVRIRDVLSGAEVELGDVKIGTDYPADPDEYFEPDDYNGIATVEVSAIDTAKQPIRRREGLPNLARYVFPPEAMSALDEIGKFPDLGELAQGIRNFRGP